MGFYDSEENIQTYISMSEGYDGAGIVTTLTEYLPAGATVLELGMGEGKDLQLLQIAGYVATGSDAAQPFIDRYNANHPEQPALLVDAVKMNIDTTFDAIYANKVLQHLNQDELALSLQRQAERITQSGILIFSLWYGDESYDMEGSFYMAHTEQSLIAVIPATLELLLLKRYREFEDDDSLIVVLRKRTTSGE